MSDTDDPRTTFIDPAIRHGTLDGAEAILAVQASRDATAPGRLRPRVPGRFRGLLPFLRHARGLLNDHRLEGGGFDSRLKARPEYGSTETRYPLPIQNRFEQPLAFPLVNPRDKCSNDFDAHSDVLEVVAWKARDFRSQEWTLNPTTRSGMRNLMGGGSRVTLEIDNPRSETRSPSLAVDAGPVEE